MIDLTNEFKGKIQKCLLMINMVDISKLGNKFQTKIITINYYKSNNEKTYRSKNNFDYWRVKKMD